MHVTGFFGADSVRLKIIEPSPNRWTLFNTVPMLHPNEVMNCKHSLQSFCWTATANDSFIPSNGLGELYFLYHNSPTLNQYSSWGGFLYCLCFKERSSDI